MVKLKLKVLRQAQKRREATMMLVAAAVREAAPAKTKAAVLMLPETVAAVPWVSQREAVSSTS